jgi:hypothetical protein
MKLPTIPTISIVSILVIFLVLNMSLEHGLTKFLSAFALLSLVAVIIALQFSKKSKK